MERSVAQIKSLRNLERIKTLVIKIGSSILTQHLPQDDKPQSKCQESGSKVESMQSIDSAQIQTERIQALSAQIAKLKKHIPEIIIVSSGAVASGFSLLGFTKRPKDIIDKQACAALGQVRLIWNYERFFGEHNIRVAQILLTKDDLSNPKRYLYAHSSLKRLLEFNVIPIINENDPVLIDELKYIETFGDNDNLAALVAGMIDADLLLILSDVDGLYTANPLTNKNAKRISEVTLINEDILRLAKTDKSTSKHTSTKVGTGGMQSKLLAAKKALDVGCNVAIIKGDDAQNITRFFAYEDIGTYFCLPQNSMKKRRFYIGYVAIPQGKLKLDSGAVRALFTKKSLLPKGILSVEGSFEAGDVVGIYDMQECEIARGKVRYNAQEIGQILGLESSKIAKVLGHKFGDEVIHRDDIALL